MEAAFFIMTKQLLVIKQSEERREVTLANGLVTAVIGNTERQ